MKVLGTWWLMSQPDRLAIVTETGFWFWKRTHQWIGSCTVWHHFPDGHMAGTLLPGALLAIWHNAKWEKEISGCDADRIRENFKKTIANYKERMEP